MYWLHIMKVLRIWSISAAPVEITEESSLGQNAVLQLIQVWKGWYFQGHFTRQITSVCFSPCQLIRPFWPFSERKFPVTTASTGQFSTGHKYEPWHCASVTYFAIWKIFSAKHKSWRQKKEQLSMLLYRLCPREAVGKKPTMLMIF